MVAICLVGLLDTGILKSEYKLLDFDVLALALIIFKGLQTAVKVRPDPYYQCRNTRDQGDPPLVDGSMAPREGEGPRFQYGQYNL